MTAPEAWYIVKQPDGHCEIVSGESRPEVESEHDDSSPKPDRWGPFASQGEAIARRVGLIRAGKCQPV